MNKFILYFLVSFITMLTYIKANQSYSEIKIFTDISYNITSEGGSRFSFFDKIDKLPNFARENEQKKPIGLGIGYSYSLNNLIKVGLELVFINDGTRRQLTADYNILNAEVKNYIRILPVIDFSLFNQGKHNIFLSAGFGIDYMNIEVNHIVYEQIGDILLNKATRDWYYRYLYSFGVGYEYLVLENLGIFAKISYLGTTNKNIKFDYADTGSDSVNLKSGNNINYKLGVSYKL